MSIQMPEMRGEVVRFADVTTRKWVHRIQKVFVEFEIGIQCANFTHARNVHVELSLWEPDRKEIQGTGMGALLDLQAVCVHPRIIWSPGGLWHQGPPRYEADVTRAALRKAVRPTSLRLAAALELPTGVVYVATDAPDTSTDPGEPQARMHTRFGKVPDDDRIRIIEEPFAFETLEEYESAQALAKAVQAQFYSNRRADELHAAHQILRSKPAA